ncbi:MAG: efflux RND transporter periplasmic adaptor subunit [Cyclobacteriaceae bacterium]|jgi:RND family efflux transporter MFP subunit|nr:efflux RND transporter periplasmic adaptor subunit [Cyclobacteriaceae bacterium]
MKTLNYFSKVLLLSYCLLLTTLVAKASGGDDHTHAGEKPVAEANGKTYFSSEAISDKYELFLKYQPIEVGQVATLWLFISDYKTNRPLDSASLKITSKEDKTLEFTISRVDKGYYEIKTTFPSAKIYSLTVTITSPLGSDLLLLQNIEPGKQLATQEEEHSPAIFESSIFLVGVGLAAGLLIMFLFMKARYRKVAAGFLVVLIVLPTAQLQPAWAHEGHDDAGKKGNNFSNAFEVPKETQFLFDVTTQPVQQGGFTESTKLFGTVIPSSNGQAVVQSPQTGRITSLNVKVGQKVTQGQVLATIEPTIDAGNAVTFLAEKNNAEAELEAAQKDYERLKSIEDIAAKRDVAEAESRYNKARENKKLFENVGNGTSNNARAIFLKSPINGTLSNFTFAIGATVNANETLFTVTNLSKVYVEAQVFDKDADKVNTGGNFMVECATTDVHKTAQVKLLAPAQSINPTNQTQRVIFEMENPDNEFKIGEFVNVQVFAAKPIKEIALPNSAISEINGRPVIFIKDSAEQYSVSYVSIGQNNGSYTVIQKGVEEGERVVVNATYQMKMIYLNQ